MNHIFDIGEQLAELCMSMADSQLPGMPLLTSRHWAEFMLEDAKNQLRAKHYRIENALPAILVNMVIKAAEQEDHQATMDIYRHLNLGYDAEDPLVHHLDDMLDEAYYDISLEIRTFIAQVVRKGEIWTCSLMGTYLTFSYCGNRAMIEASIRASGGDYDRFIRHMLG